MRTNNISFKIYEAKPHKFRRQTDSHIRDFKTPLSENGGSSKGKYYAFSKILEQHH